MNDRELLQLAARGIDFDLEAYSRSLKDDWINFWNPLTDDGAALRLAVKLGTSIDFSCWTQTVFFGVDRFVQEDWNEKDPYAATRRAIVRAAAEIGKGMKCTP